MNSIQHLKLTYIRHQYKENYCFNCYYLYLGNDSKPVLVFLQPVKYRSNTTMYVIDIYCTFKIIIIMRKSARTDAISSSLLI